MINVLLVDDHDLVRAGIKKILDDVSGIKVVGEANSGEEAVKLMSELHDWTAAAAELDSANPELFAWRQDGLNVALAFAGYAVRADGKAVHTTRETTVQGALTRARRLHALLEGRCTHAELLTYCKAELLEENYFHAVLEAVKGVAERLRGMAGLTNDGAELINQALSTKTPIIALNSLKTDTEVSEQKGIANLLIGVFGAIRNPAAHAPKVVWAMPEQDAIDVLGILSYVHRKLDNATKV